MLEQLRWKKFPVLDKGHVCLVDVMGDDYSIVEAARVSYGEGTKHISEDRTLIRYLMRHRHTTPFEMAELKFRVKVPIDCWRQWIRHRTANVNEYSTRYSIASEEAQITAANEWRLQATTNRQGSDGTLLEWPDKVDDIVEFPDGTDALDYAGPGDYLSQQEIEFHDIAKRVYNERVNLGVAREQARKDLPLSTYTEAFWKIDLHNLFHFLALRMDSHAQQEIRQFATVIGNEIVKPLFPMAWEAFEDYRLGGMVLNKLDIGVIQRLTERSGDLGIVATYREFMQCQDNTWRELERCRERDECLQKLQHLGIVES